MSLYKGERSDLEGILADTGGGQVLLWQQNDGGLVPAWALGVQEPTYWVWMSGTTSATQLMGQVAGGYWASHVDPFGSVNSWWVKIAAGITLILRNFFAGLTVPESPVVLALAAAVSILAAAAVMGQRVNFVGDSYGAAILTYVALYFAQQLGAPLVKFMTFGCPKPLCAGFAGPLPSTFVRIARTNDPVVLCPPTVPTGIWALGTGLLGLPLGQPLRWTHYGNGYVMDDVANFAPDLDDTNTGWVQGSRLGSLNVASHKLENTALILTTLQAQGRLDAQGRAVNARLLTLLGQPTVGGTVVAPLPDSDSIAAANVASYNLVSGPLTPVNIADTELFSMPAPTVTITTRPPFFGGSAMALQIAPPVDAIYGKITLFMSDGRITWTENHYMNSQTGNVADFQVQSVNLASRRTAILAGSCHLIAIRRSIVGRPKVYVTDNYDDTGVSRAGNVTENVSKDAITLGINGVKSGATPLGTYHSRFYLGGIPDPVMAGGLYDPDRNAAWVTALNSFLTYITSVGGSISNMGFLTLERDNAIAPKVVLATAIVLAGGTIGTFSTEKPHLLQPGNIVRLSRIPGVSAALPLNQNWRVKDVTDAQTFTIDLPAAAAVALHTQGQGFAQRQVITFASYYSQGRTFATTRARGVRVFAPLGRRKVRRTFGY